MKKTLITLMALAGVAAAAETVTTTYEPLKETGWTLASGRGAGTSNQAKQDIESGVVYTNDPWWKQPYGTFAFADAISLEEKTDSISFSFTLNMDTITLTSSMLTVALEGNSGGSAATIVMGYGHNYSDTDNTNFKSAVVADNSSDVYLFDTTWSDTVAGFTQYNCTSADLLGALSTSTSFTGSIAWDDAASGYILTLAQGGESASYNLGSSYEMTGISIALDGNSTNQKKDDLRVSDLSITKTSLSVPEPTTATLSLLALAGLAARRRRK